MNGGSDVGSTVLGAVLAHQGGWDEGLVVLVPLAIFVGLQVWSRRRGRGRKPPSGRPPGTRP